MDLKRKETIKFWIAIFFLLVIAGIVISVVIKYQVDGETNMPFQLSKITVISTAEGEQNLENPDNVKWNLTVNQNNDIYFYITKNENINKTHIIKSVTIKNIQITSNPTNGEIKVYMPNSGDGRRFVCNDEFLVNDSLTYTGAKESNEKNLTIGNQGGTVPIRIANCNVGKYISNEDAEIIHDGTLIKYTKTELEDIKFSVNFDMIIEIDNVKYKANIKLNLPYENILEQGITKFDITDMKNIVFKRI